MAKRLTRQEFIERAKNTHGGKFDYTFSVYVNNKIPIWIRCNDCSYVFKEVPNSHIKGSSCRNCSGTIDGPKRRSNEEVISIAREVHGDVYDYSALNHTGCRDKIEIICRHHGSFFQFTHQHLGGNGCKKCRFGSTEEKTKRFKEKSFEIHGYKYDYSKSIVTRNSDKVIIFCNTCNAFFNQHPYTHMSGHGCRDCGYSHAHSLQKRKDDFIKCSNLIHEKGLYDYSNIEYLGNTSKVEILCNLCNSIFTQTPKEHKKGGGCPNCRQSKGELIVENFLKDNNIAFIIQHKFEGCAHKRKLPFDFYLPTLNTCIEYQGKQHYEPIGFFGGIKSFKKQQKRDQIKRDFCKKEGIDLLEISYKDFNKIEQILRNKLFQEKQLTLF